MPFAAAKPCNYPGCGKLVTGGARCDRHKDAGHHWAPDVRRGNRHERGYGTAWDKTRERILRRDCGLCQPCKRRGLLTTALQVDHIVPKAAGGTDAWTNLQAICNECHNRKTATERRGRG